MTVFGVALLNTARPSSFAALTPNHLPCPASPPPPAQYGATAIALLIYALPLYWGGGRGGNGGRAGDQGEVTQDYISAMRLLSNTSK